MMTDARRYNLNVGDVFQDGREGRSGEFKIISITPDGNVFQLRWAHMSDHDLCPYVTAERIFEIANIDRETRRRFSKEDMFLAFAAGFRTSAEGHNGECNDFTDAHCVSVKELLSNEKAHEQLNHDFISFLQKEIS